MDDRRWRGVEGEGEGKEGERREGGEEEERVERIDGREYAIG